MAKLSAVPQTVDLEAYGGDTFTLAVTAPAALVDGRVWTAQIRDTRTSDTVDATFTITPPAVADGPAYLTLPADVTEGLLAGAPLVNRVNPRTGALYAVPMYSGQWDVQVAGAGGADPVTTLAQGTFTCTVDVTRL